jgi:hypothetical protein
LTCTSRAPHFGGATSCRQGSSTDDREALRGGVCGQLSFKRGDTVVSQGAPAQHFYVMTKGEATVLQLGPLPFASPYASPSASPMRLPPGGSSHSMNGMMQNMFSNMGGQGELRHPK